MRYWIDDQDETPQRFPLQQLFRRIVGVVGPGAACAVFRVSGYGATIHDLAEKLDKVDWLPMSLEEMDRLCEGVDEWCYDICAKVFRGDLEVMFGIHDSTSLFVDAEPPVAEQIVLEFKASRTR